MNSFHLQPFLGFCNERCSLFVGSVSEGLVWSVCGLLMFFNSMNMCVWFLDVLKVFKSTSQLSKMILHRCSVLKYTSAALIDHRYPSVYFCGTFFQGLLDQGKQKKLNRRVSHCKN